MTAAARGRTVLLPSGWGPWLRFAAVLILTGANDQQAAPDQVPEQEAAFKASGNADVTAQVVPGVNHLFVRDPDGFPGGYAKLPPPVRMEPSVVGQIVDWLAIRLR